MAQRVAAPGVMITVEPPGATWPHLQALVPHLAALGVEVTLASVVPVRPGQRVDCARLPGVDLVACPRPVTTPAEHMARRAEVAHWLLGVEETLNPDVVHLTGYLHAGLPWCGKVLVAGYPGSGAAYGRLEGEPRRACAAAFRHGLEGADLIVTPTGAMMAALVRNFGVPSGRVIPDGRDPLRGPALPKEPVVLSVGTLRAEPGQPSPLESAAPTLPWPVVVAGRQADGDGRPLRLSGVSVLGPVLPPQLIPWFQRAAIYVAPTAEGTGTSVPEAALGGCALVLGDTAALRELWQGAALFVPPDDPEALGAGLRTLIRDRRLREAMGEAARARARATSARAMAEAYMAAYRGLMEGRAPNQYAEERHPSA